MQAVSAIHPGVQPRPQLVYGNIEVLTSTLTQVMEEQGSSASILERMHQRT